MFEKLAFYLFPPAAIELGPTEILGRFTFFPGTEDLDAKCSAFGCQECVESILSKALPVEMLS